MAAWVANKFIKHVLSAKNLSMPLRVLILGFTFKANCNDIRNTKVYDLISSLREYGVELTIYDPVACPDDVQKTYDIQLASSFEIINKGVYSSVLVLCLTPNFHFILLLNGSLYFQTMASFLI